MSQDNVSPFPWTGGCSGASHAMPPATTIKTAIIDPKSQGIKFDSEKPRMDLIPPKGLIETAKVLGYGARKYSADNWRQVDGKDWRYFGAAQRHLWAYHSGQKFDPETGINHLAHAICSLMFLLELDLEAQT